MECYTLRIFILLLILVPAAEIGFLIMSGRTIGVLPTIALIIFTGILGAYLAKKQGIETLREAQEQLSYGRIPSNVLLDGICILVGGTLLLTPGFITDFLGFSLLVPTWRKPFKLLLIKGLQKWMNKGKFTIIR